MSQNPHMSQLLSLFLLQSLLYYFLTSFIPCQNKPPYPHCAPPCELSNYAKIKIGEWLSVHSTDYSNLISTMCTAQGLAVKSIHSILPETLPVLTINQAHRSSYTARFLNKLHYPSQHG